MVTYSVPISLLKRNLVNVALTSLSVRGDADLYLQYEHPPTLTQYASRNISQFLVPIAKTGSILMSLDNQTMVYVGVYGYTSTYYNMTVTVMYELLGWPRILVIIAPIVLVVSSILLVVLLCWRTRNTPEEESTPDLKRSLL